MSELLQVHQLDAGFGAIQIIHGLSFSLGKGERVALVGRNGVGKTTMLKTIMGLADVRAGRVGLDGQNVSAWTPRQRALAGIGYVPQTRDIFPSLTVEENLVAGLKGRPRKSIDEAYELFPRLAERRHNGGQQLSGGEQQMLSVARTLLGKPRLLLLDEPLEGLAPIICQELMAAFERLAQETGVAVILVEQKIDDALRFAPRVIVLERGEIVHEGNSAELRERILEAIRETGPLTTKEMALHTGQPLRQVSAVVRHLRVQGLVEMDPASIKRRFTLTDAGRDRMGEIHRSGD